MIDPSPAPTLPLWMQVTAFVVSIALASLKVVEFFKKPKLYLHLTRDVFFRLVDNGEALFCNAVLLSSNGPTLVRDVQLFLRRIDKHRRANKAEKSFPMVVSQYGEKVHGPTVVADHKFFGSTPLQYLEQSKPHRAVYLCFQREYQERQKRAVIDYVTAIETFRAEHSPVADQDAEVLRRAFAELIDEQFHAMASLIQLESGDYELEVTVNYECVGWKFFGVRQEATSKISFTVDQILLDKWKADLKRLLTTRGQQILSEKLEDITYPALEPVEIMESPRS